jgi:heme o synthase
MSITTVSNVAVQTSAWQRAQDYLELTKPKIALLELVTVAVAATVASAGAPDFRLVLHALFGASLVFAGASAWNQWLERDSDLLMPRTANRPLPAGRLTSREVVVFGSIAAVLGVVYLGCLLNPLTAALGAATWLLYVGIYTPLKSRSPANTAVGAVAGALPILMGWTAVGGRLDLHASTLFLIVFLWQFPHFMAIAWIYRGQYAAAGLKMSPVVDPSGWRAGAQAVIGALALVPVSLVPAVTGIAGPDYFLWSLALGVGQCLCAVAFLVRMNNVTARVLLRASLIYLPAVLVWLTFGSR